MGGETVQSLNRKYAEALVRNEKPTAASVAQLLGVPGRTGVATLRNGELQTEDGIAVKVETGAGSGAVLAVGDAPGREAALRVTPRGWNVPAKQAFATSMRAMLVGRTLLGMQVYDVLRALDYLRSRPEMQGRTITLRGRGNGAVVALFAAAIDGRTGVEMEQAPRSYMDLVRARYPQGIESLIVPGVLRHFDLPDVAALVP